MMETGIYVRVSTEEQAQEGYSIRAQEDKLKQFAGIKDWSIYNIYIDDGISGKNIEERPAINQMIEDIERGYVKNVVVFKIDRLTRSTSDLIYLVDLFNKYDCAFNSLTESIDTQTASGRMFIKIIGIFAEFERENIVERTRLGFERKAREGYTLATRTMSYGYDRNKGEKIQQINEHEARIVKEIFNEFVNNHTSYLDIAKNLNKKEIGTKNNCEWHARTIKNVLTNCNYIGKVRYAIGDEKRHFEADGHHEPIISKELFNDAQSLIKKISTKSYTKRPKEDHYFSGILFCAKCGGKLVVHGEYRKDKNGKNKYNGGYRCSNYLKKTCNASNMKHDNVEKAFQEYISSIEDFNTLDEVQMIAKKEIKNQNIELINNLSKQYKKLDVREKEILNQYIDGKLDFENYITIKNTIAKEKERTSSTLSDLENFVDEEITIKKENIIQNLKENWDLLNNEERRQFLTNFVDKIEIINKIEKHKRNGTVTIQNIEFSII